MILKRLKDLCKLCLINQATKKNSHIISKFLVESMFGSEGPRQGFIIDPKKPKGIGKKVQDSPKENYILCPICEERISVVERYASNYFHRRIRTDDLRISEPLLTTGEPDSLPYIFVPGLDVYQIRLFIYSLVWRSSVSIADGFRTLNLKEDDEERLRDILFNLLPITPSAKDLNIQVDQNKDLVFLPFIITTPQRLTNTTTNFLGAFDYNNNAALFINEYFLIVYMDWTAASIGAPQYNLPNYPFLSVTIVSEEYWENQNIIFAEWLAQLSINNK